MSSTPLPSNISLLSSLPSHTIGYKVRFLGWYVRLILPSPIFPVIYLPCHPRRVSQLERTCSLTGRETGGIGARLSANRINSVTAYSTASGTLTLQHQFPQDSDVRALVDVRLLLETISAEQTSVGQWVNVIGYITSPPSAPVKKSTKMDAPTVLVQALVLWSTGSLDIGRYEACLTSKSNPKDRLLSTT